jgi:hypothetical protein
MRLRISVIQRALFDVLVVGLGYPSTPRRVVQRTFNSDYKTTIAVS